MPRPASASSILGTISDHRQAEQADRSEIVQRACQAVLEGWRTHLVADREIHGARTPEDKAYDSCLEVCIAELEQALAPEIEDAKGD